MDATIKNVQCSVWTRRPRHRGIYTQTHTHTHTHTHTRTHARMHTYTHTHILTHTHTHARTHARTHAHTHTPRMHRGNHDARDGSSENEPRQRCITKGAPQTPTAQFLAAAADAMRRPYAVAAACVKTSSPPAFADNTAFCKRLVSAVSKLIGNDLGSLVHIGLLRSRGRATTLLARLAQSRPTQMLYVTSRAVAFNPRTAFQLHEPHMECGAPAHLTSRTVPHFALRLPCTNRV